VFAPNVTKPQTKTADDPTSGVPLPAFAGHPPSHDPTKRALFLQRARGNQATLRLLAQQAKHEISPEQMPAREAPHGVTGDFSKTPVFPFVRASQFPPSLPLASTPLPGGIQAKLSIGSVDDPLEHEADRVADHVMRMPSPDVAGSRRQVVGPVVQRSCAHCEASQDPEEDEVRRTPNISGLRAPFIRGRLSRSASAETGMLQRDIGKEEIQEKLVTAFLSSKETVQRAAANHEEDDSVAGERIMMQAKLAGPPQAQPGAQLEAAVGSLEGRGDPLPAATCDDMSSRFGHDFSGVRIHADASAAKLARQVNARAFTIGRNVAFASGEYAPNGTAESRRLLAHELTHVVQQGQAGPTLQRKISVAGKDYTPTATYLSWLNANFSPAMKEFVEHMHNGGNPPAYSFGSFDQMGFEVRTRANAIKGMEEVHKGCCDYFSNVDPPYLDSAYWDKVGAGADFKMKTPLPAGKHPSDAIRAIFAKGAGTRLECLSMTLAIQYYGMLNGIGNAKFDAQFAGGIEIAAKPNASLFTGPDRKYQIIAVASKSEILPGDWVYFKNFKDYLIRHPGDDWQGENAISMGGGKYRGFGILAMSEDDLNNKLVDVYNKGGPPKTVADLIADRGGLLLNPVIRPIISKIAP
jgi:Domain of unknown function (DUF4157)/Protein-glutamine gamma-glutamyltransferase